MRPVKMPQMILFDYGDTLGREEPFNSPAGVRAVMEHCTANPHGYSPEEVDAVGAGLFAELQAVRSLDFEGHNLIAQRLQYELMGIELAISAEEAEYIYWENVAPGHPTPGSAELLAYLNEKGIRTGVISNIGFSGGALARRIAGLFPEHPFEFILASSEYLVRKPNPMLFRVALAKAGLGPEEVWYCGNDAYFDVKGSASAGLFPVWYRGMDRTSAPAPEGTPPHLEVGSWDELRGILEELP